MSWGWFIWSRQRLKGTRAWTDHLLKVLCHLVLSMLALVRTNPLVSLKGHCGGPLKFSQTPNLESAPRLRLLVPHTCHQLFLSVWSSNLLPGRVWLGASQSRSEEEGVDKNQEARHQNGQSSTANLCAELRSCICDALGLWNVKETGTEIRSLHGAVLIWVTSSEPRERLLRAELPLLLSDNRFQRVLQGVFGQT